ncbi:unnamed protein product [Aureobasidium uvarum]|uniref:F-box domain-containing protein n=1 Tax=Aureobasidium uvarum TaxID=2773716 RepID=A0A9N8KEQ7_9PEZI|nr:unnamed protein product [Aureobasidium uvarum]
MTPLFNLPVEISDLVAGLLGCESLARLRLVCKKAHHIATPTFGRRHLQTLRPLFTHECLEALVELSENSLLRRYVKSILFASYALNSDISTVQIVLSRHDPGTRKRLLWRYKDCRERQQNLVESGKHVELIAQALNNFNDAGVLPTLGIFEIALNDSKKIPIYKGWGADFFYDDLLEASVWTKNSGNVLDAVIKAAKICDFPLESVAIDACACMTMPMGIRAPLDNRQINRELANIIRALGADFGMPNTDVFGDPVAGDADPSVDELLTKVLVNASRHNSKLVIHVKTTPVDDDHMTSDICIDWQNRRFTFESLQRYEETTFGRFRGMADMGRLAIHLGTNKFREIDISQCRVEAYVLLRFLEAHAGTLQRLRLTRIVFHGANMRKRTHTAVGSSGFIKTLRVNFRNLEYLELEPLCGYDAGWPSMFPLFPTILKLDGMQDIGSQLNLCLRGLGVGGIYRG